MERTRGAWEVEEEEDNRGRLLLGLLELKQILVQQ
jgi:hypothetical protein